MWEIKDYPIIVGGKELYKEEKIEVLFPYNKEKVGSVSLANEEDGLKALEFSKIGFEKTKLLSPYEKSKILQKILEKIEEERENLAKIICLEAGKPIKQARAEVDRCLFTFEIAKEECKRISGEIIPLDLKEWTLKKEGYVKRFPKGILLAITPFNFPLNLVAHKLAPAIAVGIPFILKPASKTPIVSCKLSKIILNSGYPEEAVNYLPMNSKKVKTLLEHPDIKIVSFTGSSEVGWGIKKIAYDKTCTLELGGNAAVVVHKDADIEDAAKKCAIGGFYYAGQSCISVQRIIIFEEIYEIFKKKLIEEVKKLKVSDPREEDCFVGPIIDEESLIRIENWVEEAKRDGAKIIIGGERRENFYMPTIIEDVKPDMKIWREEVFAPIVVLKKYKNFEEAINLVNESRFGLQAAVFTKDYLNIEKAFKEIEAGGIVINDASSFRADHQPYGGLKLSGFGREGIRWAIEEMSEIKILIKSF